MSTDQSYSRLQIAYIAYQSPANDNHGPSSRTIEAIMDDVNPGMKIS